MQKITPNLWFNRNAEEAVNFYTSLFPHSKTGRKTHYGKEGFEFHQMPEGTVLTIEFYLEDQKFVALNGGAIFKFTEAISFIVDCGSHEEVDKYWNALTADGGEESQCGWLKDKFGVSWQIVPKRLMQLLEDKDTAKVSRVTNAMLKMRKIIISDLEAAADHK